MTDLCNNIYNNTSLSVIQQLQKLNSVQAKLYGKLCTENKMESQVSTLAILARKSQNTINFI